MPDYPGDNTRTSEGQSIGLTEGHKRQQPRQLLSCTKCRERKVKCDRTQPCSACCARGQPKECHFMAEGGDYIPIQQSYELRKLRAENIRLKERLRASKIPIEEEESDAAPSPDSQGEMPSSSGKRRAVKQKRFQGSEWQDSIYFGSPGLARVVADFAAANVQLGSASLAHLTPRGPDMYAPKNPPPFPFPTFFPATPEECIPKLLKCLPQRADLFKSLSAFETRVNICSFPHIPFEITKAEVERFLDDAKKNAQMCPDMLALLFAAMALGGQHSVWDRSEGRWDRKAMEGEAKKGDVYISAAMQALRLASFMHKPSLLGIQALIMMGPYLTNSGRFLDAWTLFGTTIRLAHSIGLHRHPKHLDPSPPSQRECGIRQAIWWWMLHMDEQYSMTLGRPLGISGIGDCPPPLELTTDRQVLRFGDFVNHFTILARRVLSSFRLTISKIDELTDEFRALLDTMPAMLQFEKSWLLKEKEIPEWPLSAMAAVYHCKVHTYLILLNRQRLERVSTQEPDTETTASSSKSVNRKTSFLRHSPTETTVLSRGRALVLASSEDVLDTFIFLWARVPATLISWTMGQQAFNSCMILLLDAIEFAIVTPGARKVEKAFAIFKELQAIHKLADLAVERISGGLNELRHAAHVWTRSLGPPATHTNGNEMQGVWSEAMQTAHGLCDDRVMDTTGMILLEDPGLQSFAPEAFAPIAWNMTGDESRGFQHTPEREIRQAETRAISGQFHDEDLADHRCTGVPEGMQGVWKSTTMDSAPTSNLQPPSVTTPTSRTSLATPQQQNQHLTSFTERSHPANHPPHLWHTQLRAEDTSGWDYQPVASAPATAPPQQTGGFPGPTHGPAVQMRHNSCPSIPQLASTAPISRPGYSSLNATSVQTPIAEGQHSHTPPVASDQALFQEYLDTMLSFQSLQPGPSTHPSWVATHAGRPEAFQMMEAVNFSHSHHIGQAAPTFATNMAQGQQTDFSYPIYYSQAPALPASPSPEQLVPPEWEPWMPH
ncbi:hypothetical protein CC86DRAFT_80889 [Ophiobolus disseminans]|uniref:Zn(2)-C6 fungal-type domain-containing protein n=1 Tax=Ophiobolus disseminans TaxID=1469910 RepID=A0A6A6ZQU2_9PLEO|nr:hypothetical protein CC86DRAFT_80889 [Ophiobolus disseminans]